MADKELKKTEYAKFEYMEVDRREIKMALYNPRKISESARKKLKKNIEEDAGLITPIVINKNTMNVVSGHQRLKALDQIHRTQKYIIPVAMVDMTDQQEKEQNIFMNNPLAQGEYDFDAIAEMVKQKEVNAEKAGVSRTELFKTFGYSPDDCTPELAQEMADGLRQLRDMEKNANEQIKAKTIADFYCVFFFENTQKRDEVLGKMGLEANKYQDGLYLEELIDKISGD